MRLVSLSIILYAWLMASERGSKAFVAVQVEKQTQHAFRILFGPPHVLGIPVSVGSGIAGQPPFLRRAKVG